MQTLHHQHLLIKANVSNPPTDEKHLERWLTELVELINMKVVIPARAKYVYAEGNEGLTGSVNIETSHIAIHIWDKWSPPEIQMDVYSCSCFEADTVLKKLDEFELIRAEYMMIDRNYGFKVVEHLVGLEKSMGGLG